MKLAVGIGIGGLLIVLGLLAGFLYLFLGGNAVPSVQDFKEQASGYVEESLQQVLPGVLESKSSSTTVLAIPEAGVPLKDLSLDGAQQKILETAGIDTQSFVISKEMLACASEKVGQERLLEFMAGETPTVLEMGSLTPCLSAR